MLFFFQINVRNAKCGNYIKYVNMNLEMKSIHVIFAGFLQVKKNYFGDMFIRKNIQILEQFI